MRKNSWNDCVLFEILSWDMWTLFAVKCQLKFSQVIVLFPINTYTVQSLSLLLLGCYFWSFRHYFCWLYYKSGDIFFFLFSTTLQKDQNQQRMFLTSKKYTYVIPQCQRAPLLIIKKMLINPLHWIILVSHNNSLSCCWKQSILHQMCINARLKIVPDKYTIYGLFE